ncbi:MAG: hypothetical protein JWQ69_1062 [Pseudomonas sp.]|nr:hypothetical protein [Pseudomonas sp.]
MNIDLIVNQNHSDRQALRVAYDKAIKEGGVDEITEKCAQLVFNCPYPDAVYHEAYSVQISIPSGDGGEFFNAWDPWEVYEQAKINDRKDYTDWLANEMYTVGQNLNKEAMASGLRLEDKLVTFVVDESGLLKAVSPLNQLSPDELSLVSWLANQNEKFKTLADEYAKWVTSLVDCTIDGLDAGYARYFSRS